MQNRTFVSSPSNNLPTVDPAWVDEDVESVEIYALRPTGDSVTPFAYVDLSSATVKFAIGTTTPAALATSFTAISRVVITTVSRVQAGLTVGPAGVDEIQKVVFTGALPVQGAFALFGFAAGTSVSMLATVVRATNHGLFNGDNVYFTGTIGGQAGGVNTASSAIYIVSNSTQSTFQLTFPGSEDPIGSSTTDLTATIVRNSVGTLPIPYSASIAEIQESINQLGFVLNDVPQIAVSGVAGEEIVFTFRGRCGGRAYDLLAVNSSTLLGAPGVGTNVSYNTDEIAALVAAGTTAVTLEIEISKGAARQTFRQPATLSPDLISSTSPSPLPANVSTTFDLQSPDGSVFTFTVTNDGELSIAEIP